MKRNFWSSSWLEVITRKRLSINKFIVEAEDKLTPFQFNELHFFWFSVFGAQDSMEDLNVRSMKGIFKPHKSSYQLKCNDPTT